MQAETDSEDLPSRPVRGGRRALDKRWLAVLHRDGLAPFIGTAPEPPEQLALAVDEFNRGAYWSCHETLERLWLDEEYPLRLYYHALIKAAVGLLHLERHNRRGAEAKLQDAIYGLVPFLPEFMGLDTERLHRELVARLDLIGAGGRVGWGAIDRLPPAKIYPSKSLSHEVGERSKPSQ